jgi:hypothetical protein
MRIVDPTYGVPAEADAVPVAGGDARPGALCLFSNSKPGAGELLAGIARRLEDERGMRDIGFASKPNAAVGADAVTIDHLAARYRMAVVAIGD